MAGDATDDVSKKDATASKAEEESKIKLLWIACRRFWLSANPLYQTLILGLTLLVYLAAWAGVFVWLEKDAEEARLADVSRATEELNRELSVELPNATSDRIENIVESFFVACDAGLLANETAAPWDLGRAVMTAASIVTTTGYVKTLSANQYQTQAYTVVYALVGIPLVVAFLTVMGQLLSRIPKRVLKPLRHRYWIHLVILSSWLLIVFVALITIPAAIVSVIEGWSYREALYFCFTTLSTVGLGDYSVGQKPERLSNNSLTDFYKLCIVAWILLGLSHVSTTIKLVRDVWGGLWMRMKKCCRRVKQGVVYRANRLGKSVHFEKSAGGGSASRAETGSAAKASAGRVKRKKSLEEETQADHVTSPSEVMNRGDLELVSEMEIQSKSHKQQKKK